MFCAVDNDARFARVHLGVGNNEKFDKTSIDRFVETTCFSTVNDHAQLVAVFPKLSDVSVSVTNETIY